MAAPQAWLILGSMAAAQATSWVLLVLLARRSPGASLPIVLAIASAVASITIMLSAYDRRPGRAAAVGRAPRRASSSRW